MHKLTTAIGMALVLLIGNIAIVSAANEITCTITDNGLVECGGIVLAPVDNSVNDQPDQVMNDSESFNPTVFYSQSCGPEMNSLGGCTWDIGTMGLRWSDQLQRETVQVGIVKGASISWGDMNDNGHGICQLVVLTPDNWFENLTIKDANVTIYDVWPGDVTGWIKTLAVQNAQEQSANYGCPNHPYAEIQQWGSGISSPPAGVEGFSDESVYNPEPVFDEPMDNDEVVNDVPSTDTSNDQSANCETVNCRQRQTTADNNGTLKFGEKAAVYGWEIKIGNKTFNNCYFETVPGEGMVTDGVVNYWPNEVRKARACNG